MSFAPMTPTPKAILFDLDGTILDWWTGMEERWRAACEAGCAAGDGITPDALLAAVLEKRAWFWDDQQRAREARMDVDAASARIVHEALLHLGQDLPDLATSIARDYRGRQKAALRPYPGALETLDALTARGIAMALVTNGAAESQRASIDRFGLARYFACIVIEGEFGCGKPDERCFQHALDTLGCTSRDAWFVGDSLEADIATPLRLGMHTVWVDVAGEGLPADSAVRPHRIVRSIAELL